MKSPAANPPLTVPPRPARLAAFLFLLALLSCAENAGAARIDSLEKIQLGGIEQTILIRGRSTDKPILLFLHGGPGIPEIPVAHAERDLERDFLVVQWDQRGAGKSFRENIPLSAMRVGDFVADAEALTRYLLRRFQQPKLYLAGYSWGSLIGIRAAAHSPGLFCAYIGLSQLVDVPMSDQLLYQQTLARARARRDWSALRELTDFGPPPYSDARRKSRANALARRLAGKVPHRFTSAHYAALALFSPYYSFADDARLLKGIRFSQRAVIAQIRAANLFQEVPRLDVPAYFFEGRNDTVLSPILVERYFHALVAPHGKWLVWFEQSAHGIQIEERGKYHAALREVLRETSGKNAATSHSGRFQKSAGLAAGRAGL